MERTNSGLVALVSACTPDGELVLSELSLDETPASDADRALAVAYRALARVARVSEAREHVFAVLSGTIAPKVAPRATKLRLEAEPVGPRPTAANPRAFKGTKAKPKKPAHIAPIDLRTALQHPRTTAQLAAFLGLSKPDAQVDYFFAKYFARATETLDEAGVRRMRSLVRQLAPDAMLAAGCARLLSRSPEGGPGWLQTLSTFAPDQRKLVVRALAISGHVCPPEALGTDVLDALRASWAAQKLDALLAGVLEAQAQNVDMRLVAFDLALRGTCYPRSTRPFTYASPFHPGVKTLLEGLVPDTSSYRRIELFSAFDRSPGLLRLAILVEQSAPSIARHEAWARILLTLSHRDRAEDVEAYTRALIGAVPRLSALIADMHPARLRVLPDDFRGVLDVLDALQPGERDMRACLEVLGRFGARSLPSSDGWMIGALLRLPSALCAEALRAPDASFDAFLRAAQRRNDAKLYAYGLSALARHSPALFARTFRARPGSLLRTARWLGTLTYERREALVPELSEHPLMHLAAETLSPSALVYALDAVGKDAGIVPRALRAHVDGGRALRSAQLERHLARVTQRVDEARLRLFERAAVRAQLDSVGLHEHHPERALIAAHATAADENRRPMRRMLRAYFEGDREYVLRHPSTQLWRRRQEGLDVEAWLTADLERDADAGVLGPVKLRIERDPLEALKLGTYAGSCLGLGGLLTYSAAAVVLDANKHVVYARTLRGEVVARQLVAVTDTGKLAAYAVYGDARVALRTEFERFDADLARLVRSTLVYEDEGYFVPTILSRGFWDDGLPANEENADTKTTKPA